MEAARAAGVRRFVAQSYAGWPFESHGSAANTEEVSFAGSLPEEMRSTADAIRHLEGEVLSAEPPDGIVLRYGSCYGPGTSLAPDGEIVAAVRKRQMPIVGDGGGVWSFLHVGDAAAATVAALERGAPGVYNVVDDVPTTMAAFLPELARMLDAKPPRHVPEWLAKPLIGEAGVYLMTRVPGVSNARAKADLRWSPRFPSWEVGFRAELDERSMTA